MPPSRTKCPPHFSADAVVGILEGSSELLAPWVTRCRDGGELFYYNYTVKPYDKESLLVHKPLLSKFLMANSCGIFRKTIMVEGLRRWDASNGKVLTSGRTDTFIFTQAYNLIHMFLVLKSIRKSCRSGARLPTFLWEMVQLLDTVATFDAGKEDEKEEHEKEEEELEELEEENLQPSASSMVPVCIQRANFLQAAALSGRRCILRRKTSTATEDSTPCMQEDMVEQDLVEPKKEMVEQKIPQGSLAWFDESAGVAKLLVGNETFVEDSRVADASGFTKFFFKNNWSWLSMVPALGVVEEAPSEACKPILRRPSMSGNAERKRVHSRAYHAAEQLYKQECKQHNIELDKKECRERAQKAAKLAVQQWLT